MSPIKQTTRGNIQKQRSLCREKVSNLGVKKTARQITLMNSIRKGVAMMKTRHTSHYDGGNTYGEYWQRCADISKRRYEDGRSSLWVNAMAKEIKSVLSNSVSDVVNKPEDPNLYHVFGHQKARSVAKAYCLLCGAD